MNSDTGDTLAAMYVAAPGAAAFLPLVFGLVVVGILIAGFAFGRRVRAREPRPPRPEEQPKRPPERSARRVSESPDEQ
ncbi:DUF6479 family protein [Streptomyces sp. NPDC127033]|uniref:DUF6479 family protein n=1 Tax=Streptomyces sp. NPDC127033 TaxID=3347110 RepID=UPI0036571493